MDDNRFAMMRVNRSGKTSRSGHGNEAVPTGHQGTRATPAQGHADAGARRGTSRSGAYAGSQSADHIKLGQEAGRGPASVAAQAVGRPGGLDAAQKKQLGKALLAGAVANDFPTELWTLARVAKLIEREFGVAYEHGQRLAHPARVGVLQPASGRSCHPARRSGDQAMAHQALAGAKKSPDAKGAPSSSSTKAD